MKILTLYKVDYVDSNVFVNKYSFNISSLASGTLSRTIDGISTFIVKVIERKMTAASSREKKLASSASEFHAIKRLFRSDCSKDLNYYSIVESFNVTKEGLVVVCKYNLKYRNDNSSWVSAAKHTSEFEVHVSEADFNIV